MSQATIDTIKHLLKYVGPVVAVVVGWVLHELSDWATVRREDRRAAGTLLTELLELRRSIRVIPLIQAQLRARGATIPAEQEPQVRAFYSSLVSQLTFGLSSRYNKAIDSIAGRLPLLAFESRSKVQLDPVLNHLRSATANDPNASKVLSIIEDKLREEILPRLETLARRIAWIHGWRTWLEVNSQFKSADDDDESAVSDFIDSVAKAAGLQQPPPPEKR